jgi:hypothetical protein
MNERKKEKHFKAKLCKERNHNEKLWINIVYEKKPKWSDDHNARIAREREMCRNESNGWTRDNFKHLGGQCETWAKNFDV